MTQLHFISLEAQDGRSYKFSCSDYDQPCSILYKVASDNFGYVPDSLQLKYGDKILEKTATMRSYGITKYSTVTCSGTVVAPPRRRRFPWFPVSAATALVALVLL